MNDNDSFLISSQLEENTAIPMAANVSLQRTQDVTNYDVEVHLGVVSSIESLGAGRYPPNRPWSF